MTPRYLPVGSGGGTVGDFLHLVEAGDVVAIDSRGRLDCTVRGNILTEAAKAKGVAATVMDGVNRDLGESLAFDCPVWSRAAHPRAGKDRVALEAANVPVVLGAVRVDPGYVVSADHSSVVCVPLARAEEALAAAGAIEAEGGGDPRRRPRRRGPRGGPPLHVVSDGTVFRGTSRR